MKDPDIEVYRGILFDALNGFVRDLQNMKTESTVVPPAYREGWNEALEVAAIKFTNRADETVGRERR